MHISSHSGHKIKLLFWHKNHHKLLLPAPSYYERPGKTGVRVTLHNPVLRWRLCLINHLPIIKSALAMMKIGKGTRDSKNMEGQ